MNIIKFEDAERYEPDAGWRRVALAGSDRFSFEWFAKPPGHSSPMHHHENEQVCVCLDGRLVVHFEEERVELGPRDSVWIEPNEPHRVEDPGAEPAAGLDVFAPGRSFDFWTDRDADDA